MISDGIYFRNVIIQALKDLVLESFVLLVCSLSTFVFGFVWDVFFAMYFCILEISLQALFAGYGKEVCIHGAAARPNCCAFGITCFRKAWY